jgi:hypothetical protein
MLVDPTAALLPLAGEHDEFTGAVPPAIVGAAYEIATGLPSGDVSSWLTGQLIANDEGCEGELHAVVMSVRSARENSSLPEVHEASRSPRPPAFDLRSGRPEWNRGTQWRCALS